MSKLIFASTISEIQQSDVFMTVKARICEAPEANLNGARVTEAFIDEIVGNDTRYVGLPLYADVKALTNGNYNRLGHLYDVKTGEFHSTQIGSFYRFEKQSIQNGCALIGYARIPKRNRKLSKAISELFADNALKFSFELSVGEYEELDDETILIDASENNYLEGTAIVTYPACEDAVALELVAQKADETRKGESEMAEVETKAEVVETEAAQPELAEEKKVEAEEVEETAETETASEKSEETVEEAACKDEKKNAENETAAVVMREYTEERHTQCAYDTETGKEICQTVSIETHTSDVVEGNLVQTVDGVHVAEADGDGAGESGGGETTGNETTGGETTGGETNNQTTGSETQGENGSGESGGSGSGSDQSDPEPAAEEDTPVVDMEQKKTAEQLIAEMLDMINDLKSEIAGLKEQKQIAEATPVIGEVNPFIDTLKTENKYSLLEKDEKVSGYSLLSK